MGYEYDYQDLTLECCQLKHHENISKNITIMNLDEYLCINMCKIFDRITIRFDQDIKSIRMSNLQNENSLKVFFNELKKIGTTSESGNEFRIKVNYLKAAIYEKRQVYVYINEDYDRKNKIYIDRIISSGIKRKDILIENKYNSVIPLLIKNIGYSDVIFIPSIDILKDCEYLGELIKTIIYKQADLIIDENILLGEELAELDKNFLIDQLVKILKNGDNIKAEKKSSNKLDDKEINKVISESIVDCEDNNFIHENQPIDIDEYFG